MHEMPTTFQKVQAFNMQPEADDDDDDEPVQTKVSPPSKHVIPINGMYDGF